jgi:hypothetical protein
MDSEKDKPTIIPLPREAIVDDDRYTELIDIEKGESFTSLQEDSDLAPSMGLPQSNLSSISDKNKRPVDNGSLGTDVSIAEVYGEEKTHERFVHRLSTELGNIKAKYKERSASNEYKRFSAGSIGAYSYNSNSPLTMSGCSSRNLSDNESDLGDNHTLDSKRNYFKKITYQDVEESLNKHYTKEVQMSSELDILLTYLKGQRHIFNQANRITLQKFNMLMFPAIFITGSMTVIAPFLDTVGWNNWLFSILNALLTVMITINNFMKWQAVAAIYLTISNQYDKLAISVEMSRNEYMFSEEKRKGVLILEKMRETEKRIMDIQNNYNDIIIPYEIQLMNPIISHINIFSFIKKIEHHKKALIIKYKDVKNEIRYIMFQWEKQCSNESISSGKNPEDLERMQRLLEKKEEVKKQMMQNNSNNVYAYIDNLFIREIRHSDKYYTYHSAGMYFIFRPKQLERFTYGNSVVDDYLNFIFTQ